MGFYLESESFPGIALKRDAWSLKVRQTLPFIQQRVCWLCALLIRLHSGLFEARLENPSVPKSLVQIWGLGYLDPSAHSTPLLVFCAF